MRRWTLAAAALVLAAACGGGGSTSPVSNNSNGGNNSGNNGSNNTAPNTVVATTSNQFSPSSLTVTLGTTVSFVFEAVGHNVTFAAGASGAPADISGSNMNVTITRQFSQTGTFGYQCTIHPGMTGTIIVTQ